MKTFCRGTLGVLILAAASAAGCADVIEEQDSEVGLTQQALDPVPDETRPIGQKWRKLGAQAVVGDATSDVQTALGGIAEYQTFTHGVIVNSTDFGAVYLSRAVHDKWLSLRTQTTGAGGNLFTYLGVPTQDSVNLPGRVEGSFERGLIVVEPGNVARVVYGDIYGRYTSLRDALGLPRSEEAASAGAGRVQLFERGEIQWKQGVGAFGLWGAILDRYRALGSAGGALGYPKSDINTIVSSTAAVLGQSARFENGAIFESAATGAWEVNAGLLVKYESQFGGPAGWLGFPISGQGTSGAGDAFNDFQGGVLVARGTDSAGNPVVYPFGRLDFHLQRVEARGDDCSTCGAQDLFYFLHVDSSNGPIVHQRFPGSGEFCQGCDSHDPAADWLATPAARSSFTVTASVNVWDNDLTNEDELGTVTRVYSIDNLWGYLEGTEYQSGDGYANLSIKNSYAYDASDFRGQTWWSFENFKTEELSYNQYAQTFADVSPDESAWFHPFNKLYYELAYKGVADSGNCFGMTLESIYAQLGRSSYGQPIHQYFPDTQDGSEPSPSKPAHASLINELNVKMGYQLGAKSVVWSLAMFAAGQTHDPRNNFLASGALSLLGDYPLISIFDDYLFGGGHSVRPYKWDVVPGACTRLAGADCVKIHIADPNYPTGDSAEDDYIEVNLLTNYYDYRKYQGGEWFGGRMFFQPFHLFNEVPSTPFGQIFELIENGFMFIVGSTAKTNQITDSANRTFFEPGLSGPPTRWDQVRQDAGSRIPNLAPLMLTSDEEVPRAMPIQIYAGKGIGATHRYDVVPAPGVPAGTPYEVTFESGKLSAHFTIPGTPGKPDSITAESIGTADKAIAIKLPADGAAKAVSWTVSGPQKQRWAELTGLPLVASQRVAIAMDRAGYNLVINNDGPATYANLRVKAGPGATPVVVGRIEIPNGETTTEFELPVTTLTMSNETFGQNGWYIAPATVTLTAKDFSGLGIDKIEHSPDALSWMNYTAPFAYVLEGQTTLFYRARDKALNVELPKSRAFKLDTRVPEVGATTDQSSYTRVQAFTVHFTASDPVPGSGLESVLAKLDGTPVSDGQSFDLLWLPLGTHTVSVTAKDVAGWTATDAAPFDIVATLQSLPELIRELRRRGEIDSDGISKSLLAKAEGAVDASARGNRKAAINKLEALVHELNAQSGKHVSARAAALLKGDTQYVISHMP